MSRHHEWTPEEDARLEELLKEGKFLPQIVELMRMPYTVVKYRMAKLNLHRTKSSNPSAMYSRVLRQVLKERRTV